MKKLPATLTGQPSGKTLKAYVIAANDAGQAAPSDGVNRGAVSFHLALDSKIEKNNNRSKHG